MKNNIGNIIVVFILVILMVLISDFFMPWMPPMAIMPVVILVTVAMSIWAGFVMKEQASDEREMLHRMNAGRVAYLSGIGILTLALIVQGISHNIDPWVTVSLAVMIVTKLAIRLHSDHYR